MNIPPKTADKLNASHPPGSRHKAALDIAISLIGQGFPPTAVFQTLRSKFDQEKTDKELHDVVQWAVEKNPSPADFGPGRASFKLNPVPEKPKRTPAEQAKWWLSGATMDKERFKSQSQLPIPDSNREALATTLEMLYLGNESLNIVCKFIEEGGKAKPSGPGRIMTRDKWVEYVRSSSGVPQSKAGAWVRPNPCTPQGSGHTGAVTDSDVTAWRFLLLESDVLPLESQLALFSKLKLPIAAVIMSGGISAHAWVKLDAKSAASFSETGRRILSALEPFGIDQANKNPSRLSRLPGAVREIGGVGEGVQELLWLNPGRSAIDEKSLSLFEASLEFPAVEEKPFKTLVKESLERYEELLLNKGKLGTPTGFSDFDRDTGGLFPGQMSIVAAETGAGKSTFAMNVVNAAAKNNHPVALFTLEMGREEIADIVFSLNCNIDRNHFNTGEFTNQDMQSMSTQVETLCKFPLWVFDESTLTAKQIRQRILHLKSESNLALAVVDYAQIVSPESTEVNREQQVASAARELCATAKDAKVALLVLSQLNDDRKLRESRVIAHEAHNVFLIENKEQENKMIMKVIKGRRIRKKDYTLYYEPIFCRITSMARDEPARNYYDR